MKNIFLKFIVFFLGIFGISTIGCPPAYGMPFAIYKLSGKVVDKETSQPIEDIQVIFKENDTWSNNTGNWEIIPFEKVEQCYNDCYIIVRDTDGDDNGGNFEWKIVNISPIKTGDNVYEQHNILVEMEKLSPEKNY